MTRWDTEHGSAAVELVLLTPALVVLLLFVVLTGRLGQARHDVVQAAGEAARAASLHADPASAAAAARDAAHANLNAAGVRCAAVTVNTDVGGLAPGGSVTVSVACTAALADVAVAGMPGSRTLHAQAVEVVDTYRGGG